CVRLDVIEQIGPYDEGFFIDCIDFDFCLRLRAAGYQVHRVSGAVMRHQVGDAVRMPRLVTGFYARHPPARRYYMFRNYLSLMERYLVAFPWFIIKLGVL